MIPRVTQTAKDAADAIRQGADHSYARYRGRKDLSETGSRIAMAKAYTKAAAQMADAQAAATAAAKARRDALTSTAFGLGDSAGMTAVDRAAAAMNARDAADRAEKVTDAQQASALMQRAHDTGDDLLARAVARHAFTQALNPLGGQGWDTVVNAFVETRPALADAIQTLADDTRAGGQGPDVFAYVLPKPAELGTMHEYQINDLAKQTFGDA